MENGAALLKILPSKSGEAEAGITEGDEDAVQSSGQEHGLCNLTSWNAVTVQSLSSQAKFTSMPQIPRSARRDT